MNEYREKNENEKEEEAKLEKERRQFLGMSKHKIASSNRTGHFLTKITDFFMDKHSEIRNSYYHFPPEIASSASKIDSNSTHDSLVPAAEILNITDLIARDNWVWCYFNSRDLHSIVYISAVSEATSLNLKR